MKSFAPMMMTKTAAVISAVLRIAASIPRHRRPPKSTATISAPNAPTAPASVAVTAPEYMPPSTSSTSRIAGAVCRTAASRCAQSAGGASGARPGRSFCHSRIVVTNSAASTTPGTMPAVNRSTIEVSVLTPYISNGTLGGIITANVPPAATDDMARRSS